MFINNMPLPFWRGQRLEWITVSIVMFASSMLLAFLIPSRLLAIIFTTACGFAAGWFILAAIILPPFGRLPYLVRKYEEKKWALQQAALPVQICNHSPNDQTFDRWIGGVHREIYDAKLFLLETMRVDDYSFLGEGAIVEFTKASNTRRLPFIARIITRILNWKSTDGTIANRRS